MKITEIIENNFFLIRDTIYELGFSLAEVSSNVYPDNHHNYLSGKFSNHRITPRDIVAIVEYLKSRVGESVFNQSYTKEFERYNKYSDKG
ncbi:MAG: hypothetical protein M0P71_14270 [Melioribacteraceae bacterium]|nr:hypothetical protein [Melioribacteraceae bacterium]